MCADKKEKNNKKKAFLLLLRFCAFLELIWSQPAPSLLLFLLSYYILSFLSFLSFHSLYVYIDVQRVISEFQCRNPLGSRGDGDTGGKTAHTLHQNLCVRWSIIRHCSGHSSAPLWLLNACHIVRLSAPFFSFLFENLFCCFVFFARGLFQNVVPIPDTNRLATGRRAHLKSNAKQLKSDSEKKAESSTINRQHG
jgi:hypothetical protein